MITITTPYVAYATDGATTQFGITFEYKEGDPLEVILAEPISEEEQNLISGTHYVIEGSETLGWALRTIDTYSSGYDLYIIRDSDQVQDSDYVENDPLPAERLEYDYDKIVKMLQEIQRQTNRSLKLRKTAGTVDVEMADPVDGSVLKYDASSGRYEAVKALDLVQLTILSWMEAFLESVDYEEARTHLGGDADWHEVGDTGEPPFENGWANSGGSYATMAFRLDSSGYVHLKGRVQGGTPDSTIFTLPVDYRPAKDEKFSAPHTDGEHHIKVQSDGKVIDIAPSGSAFEIPVGFVLMYDGTEVDTPDTRTEKLGDRVGDGDFSLLVGDWYVCNGQSGTPDMRNSFLRMESAKGSTGGSDDAINVSHDHSINHDHPNLVVGGGSHAHNLARVTGGGGQYGLTIAAAFAAWVGGASQASSHSHNVNLPNFAGTSGSAGASGTDANRPVFYSMIPIKRVA